MWVKVEVDTNERCTQEPDRWSYSSYVLDIFGARVTENESESPKHDFEVDARCGDTVVVLVEHYSDGGTFGHNDYAEVKGVFLTNDEARKYSTILNKDHGYFGSHIDFLYFNCKIS